MPLQNPCPCGSETTYTECCGPYLAGEMNAPTAEALMRSRYTASARGDVDYLIKTRHPDTRKPSDRRVLKQSTQLTQWVKLTVLKTKKGLASDKTGMVEFVAEFRDTQAQGFQAATTHQLHERSRFVKEAGQWYYTEGDILPPIKLKK